MTGRRITLIVAGPRSRSRRRPEPQATGADDGDGPRVLREPVQDLGNEDLTTDQKDARSAVPPRAYHQVQLTNLDGSGFLQGQYVQGRNDTGPSAYSTTGDYRFFRDQGQFEQVMAYYWITEAQKYLQSLGFTGSRAILDEGIDVRINQWGQDNSFFWDKHQVRGSAKATSTTPRTPR